MKTAWIRNVKGSRLANAADVFSCEENDSPLCCAHSVPRLVWRLQIGALSLTKILFNARLSPCSIEDRAVRTRVSCSETRLWKAKTCVWPDSAVCRVRSMESTTLCTLCKTGGSVWGCFADWSVVCQVLVNLSRRPSCSSRLVACCVSSRADTDERTPKFRQATLSR